MRIPTILYVLSGLLIAGLAIGQQSAGLPNAQSLKPEPPPPTFKAETEEVVLDVIFRDKKGKYLTDLTAADVKVFDDGVERKVKSMRLVTGAEAVEKGARVPLDAMRQIRLVTLAFQQLGDSGRRIARDAAQNLVKGDQAQNVFYSVVAIDRQLNVLQAFTRDKEALKKAIELATSGKYSSFAAESARIKSELREIAGRAVPSAPAAVPAAASNDPTAASAAGAAAGAAAIAKRTAEIMLEMLSFDSSFSGEESTRMSILALQSLVRGQYSLPGRKSILYFSEGMWVPPHLDEAFNGVMSAANRGNVAFYSVDARGVMTWSQNQSAMDSLASAARDIRNDTTSSDGQVSKAQIMASDRAETSMRNNVQLPLRTLAESTGGFLIGDANDLRPALKQVNEEVSSYYEISYEPGIEVYDGKFRKTRVDVDRKDTIVHARNGYFALPISVRGAAVSPYEFALLKAMDSTPAPEDVEFRSAAIRIDSDADGASGIVMVEVPMSGIKFTEDAKDNTFHSRVSLMAVLKDEKGEVVQKLTNDLPRKGPLNLLPQARGGNFIYTQPVRLAPGRYTLETAVLDHEASKTGVKRAQFEVKARTSGVGISNLCLVRNYQANAKDLDPKEPMQFQGGKVTATLSGHIFAVKGAQLSTFFIVHPDPAIKDKPVANVEFILDGAAIATQALPLPAPDAMGRIPFVMSVPAEALPPATYEIKISVKQGNSTAEDRMKVEVLAK